MQGLLVRRKLKQKRKKSRRGSTGITNNKAKYDPSTDDKIKSDPHSTIFIARLDFNTTEETLSNVFERYGTIKSLRIVTDTITGKSKGYAFIEFSDSSETKRVLRETREEDLVIDGRKILVDRVRAGTTPSWLPRRLGGGLGHRQRGTQRFVYKLPYFGDASRIDHVDVHRKQQLWMEHNRRSMKIST
ncbi:uncharacterized protein [Montipora capricornis]|uniref:uncharacterized protein n=1 Tax=Montipora capricornis TaxID=246305 RepID=UPI0035F1D618